MASESLTVTAAGEQIAALESAICSVVRGKPEVVQLAIVCLLSRGHLLIEDVPGVGKTTLAHALARAIDCDFNRVQFTSDLLPTDVIGVTVYSAAREEFDFKPGPIFTNFLLADEINRTTPKTQSALLEAMNEGQVSIDGRSYPLPKPYMVIATQNPVEYHGTFPLPEAQLDRFLLRIEMGYPDQESEKDLLRQNGNRIKPADLQPVMHGVEIEELQNRVASVQVHEDVLDYILAIVQATRSHPQLSLGVSPRGSLALHRAAQAAAFIAGREYVTPHDVKTLVGPVFAHRVTADRRFGADSGSLGRAGQVLDEIMASIPTPL